MEEKVYDVTEGHDLSGYDKITASATKPERKSHHLERSIKRNNTFACAFIAPRCISITYNRFFFLIMRNPEEN